MPQDRAHRSDVPAPGGDPSIGTTQGSVPDGRGVGTYFLGRYRVVDEIGIGGMASVHLARMDGPGGFQKWVAIKRIHPHLVEDQTFIHMFLDEARIAARISHSNVATVFDLGEHEDTYWIAMEYLHGEPLREVMRRTEELAAPMPPEIACRVIADAAEGLHAAHELLGKNGEKLGLVHRDVTPHNLFVTYDGTTKVVDFGIAKFSSRMSSTRAGTLKGKLAYMSPEQVHGEGIDRRTDIFALGVVLWELTTGQRLFRMESDLDTLAKVQECNVPRPSSIVRGYPIDLEKIVMKALSKNRGERFKTAREFSRALQSLLMRRGLFIASDEVAAYMKQIFDDRIKKREAHLRWAAEVTQTINIEGILTRPQPPIGSESSLVSYNSEVQPAPPSARHGAVRPAAGMPAEVARPPTLTNQSAPTTRGGVRQPDTLRPPVKNAPGPAFDDPSYDEGPTLQASPKARAQMMAEAEAAGLVIPGDDNDDNDDTIVTTTRVEPGNNPAAFLAPVPAAGKPATVPPPPATQRGPGPLAPSLRENVAFAAPPRSVPPRAPPPPALPAVVVAPPGSAASPPLSSGSDSRSTAHVDALLAEALAEQRGPGAAPQALAQGIDDALRLPPSPRQNHPTIPRLFAPPLPGELRTDTARKLNRPPPMWMVAAGAFVAALFAAGLVIMFASWSTRRGVNEHAATASPQPTSVDRPGRSVDAPSVRTVPASANPDRTTANGPFGAARSAFALAIAVTPTAAAAPPLPTAAPAPPPPAPPTAAVVPATPEVTPTPPAPSPTPRSAAPLPVAAAPAPRPVHKAPSEVPAPVGGDTGQISIICFPACDAVYDNGQLIGPSPIFRRTVPVGEHKLRMTRSNPPVTKVVSEIVMGNQATTVRQPMTP
ncbi:MAG: serine/threonine-protein kinase [Polyangiaceae bacterium]